MFLCLEIIFSYDIQQDILNNEAYDMLLGKKDWYEM
jgi:hypothetical protein